MFTLRKQLNWFNINSFMTVSFIDNIIFIFSYALKTNINVYTYIIGTLIFNIIMLYLLINCYILKAISKTILDV